MPYVAQLVERLTCNQKVVGSNPIEGSNNKIMRNFTTEDFAGSGQYIIRADKPANKYVDTGFITTILKKVAYKMGLPNRYILVDMSDGLITDGVYNKETKIFTPFTDLQSICDYLNNPEIQEYRFATQEEVVRAVMYQKSRWREF